MQTGDTSGSTTEDTSGSTMRPRAGRVFIVEQVPKALLTPALAGEGAFTFELGRDAKEVYYQSDWSMVSHTFTLLEDGSGLLTYILERNI